MSWMMMCYDAIISVPIYQCFIILSMMCFGFVFFQEQPQSWAGFCFCVFVACCGILAMTTRRKGGMRKDFGQDKDGTLNKNEKLEQKSNINVKKESSIKSSSTRKDKTSKINEPSYSALRDRPRYI
eukprot:UN30982